MSMPLLPADGSLDVLRLLTAIPIGLLFGFFLERGGLGDAKILSAQFYLRNFAVFQVMFTAILTASLGLYGLRALGVISIQDLSISPTYLWPQFIAGLLFGIGFVISGLCPGTACVALSTGKLDGLAVLLGIFSGILLFSGIYPGMIDFYFSSGIGRASIADLMGLSPGLVLLCVSLLALVAFYLIFWKGRKQETSQMSVTQIWRTIPPRTISLIILPLIMSVGIWAAIRPFEPVSELRLQYQSPVAGDGKIGVHRLAEDIMNREDSYIIVDLREMEDYQMYHIPGAMHHTEISEPSKDVLVVYGDDALTGSESLSDQIHLTSTSIIFLQGGMERWVTEVLFPDLHWSAQKDSMITRLERMSRYFGGEAHIIGKAELPGNKAFTREGC